MNFKLVAATLFVLILFIALLLIKDINFLKYIYVSPKKRAGILGENIATNMIRSVLREDDYMFTNVEISYDGRKTEIDNVVVNKRGVFIFEIKNYKGYLEGNKDDFEWKKFHTTSAGNTYIKMVKNPIKQVRRQIYLLANYLNYYGEKVWVSGYAMLLNKNSPVDSEYIVVSADDIDKAIHTQNRNRLTDKDVDQIVKILE